MPSVLVKSRRSRGNVVDLLDIFPNLLARADDEVGDRILDFIALLDIRDRDLVASGKRVSAEDIVGRRELHERVEVDALADRLSCGRQRSRGICTHVPEQRR